MSPPVNHSGTVSPATPGAALHGQPHTHKVSRRTAEGRAGRNRPQPTAPLMGHNPDVSELHRAPVVLQKKRSFARFVDPFLDRPQVVGHAVSIRHER